MADQDWDKKIGELRDVQLVTQRMMERNERAWNDRFEILTAVVEKHERRLDALATVAETHEQRLDALAQKHEDEMAELRAALASLITHIDQFIQGRGPNGR